MKKYPTKSLVRRAGIHDAAHNRSNSSDAAFKDLTKFIWNRASRRVRCGAVPGGYDPAYHHSFCYLLRWAARDPRQTLLYSGLIAIFDTVAKIDFDHRRDVRDRERVPRERAIGQLLVKPRKAVFRIETLRVCILGNLSDAPLEEFVALSEMRQRSARVGRTPSSSTYR
jgi:hypothetical protein